MNYFKVMALGVSLVSASIATSYACENAPAAFGDENKYIITKQTLGSVADFGLKETFLLTEPNAIDAAKSALIAIKRAIYTSSFADENPASCMKNFPELAIIKFLDVDKTRDSTEDWQGCLNVLKTQMHLLADDYSAKHTEEHLNPKQYMPIILEGMEQNPVLKRIKDYFLNIEVRPLKKCGELTITKQTLGSVADFGLKETFLLSELRAIEAANTAVKTIQRAVYDSPRAIEREDLCMKNFPGSAITKFLDVIKVIKSGDRTADWQGCLNVLKTQMHLLAADYSADCDPEATLNPKEYIPIILDMMDKDEVLKRIKDYYLKIEGLPLGKPVAQPSIEVKQPIIEIKQPQAAPQNNGKPILPQVVQAVKRELPIVPQPKIEASQQEVKAQRSLPKVPAVKNPIPASVPAIPPKKVFHAVLGEIPVPSEPIISPAEPSNAGNQVAPEVQTQPNNNSLLDQIRNFNAGTLNKATQNKKENEMLRMFGNIKVNGNVKLSKQEQKRQEHNGKKDKDSDSDSNDWSE